MPLVLALLWACTLGQQSPEEALDAGRSLKWQMRGKVPFRREAARMGAVRAFRAGFTGGGEPELRALCALRAGELLRAAGLDEPGLTDLMGGAVLSPSTLSQRCMLTAGEALIVAGRHADAARFLDAFEVEGVPSRLIESARVLRGVSLKVRGEGSAAVLLWREVAEEGVTPRARLDAFERWGEALLSDGDVDGAAGVLHLCRKRLSVAALEATAQGREVRALLRRSSLATSIRRAMCSRQGERSSF
jgi:hypothetical protein